MLPEWRFSHQLDHMGAARHSATCEANRGLTVHCATVDENRPIGDRSVTQSIATPTSRKPIKCSKLASLSLLRDMPSQSPGGTGL